MLQVLLVAFIAYGSYRLGKVSSDVWWQAKAQDGKELAAKEIIAQQIEVTHALYDWNRPIKVGLYVGCTDKHPLIFNGITIAGTDLDYGIWLACPSGQVDMFGGTIRLEGQMAGIEMAE